ncbi:MAG TPA: methyltransferase domain-containing protein [Caulobacteraceae bacterium]|jgi:SAM-dependent methyltransferase
MTDDPKDYLLGTHGAELQRLGLQHRVWRPRVLDAWRRAGITEGSTVIDAGAGPGWATVDLAEIVGPAGRVHALERSERYFAHLQDAVAARGLSQVSPTALDLVTDALPVQGADAFWIRWVLAFVDDPAAVLAKLAGALRPGGVALIHEYLDWGVFRLMPGAPLHREFVEFVLSDWRASGGEPDIARELPALLPAAGLRVREVRPLSEVVRPSDFVFRWPDSFVRIYLEHLVEAGKRDRAWADAVLEEWEAAAERAETLVATPLVLEIIAERV